MKKTTLSVLGAVALLLCAVACGNKTADKHNEPEYECIAYVWEADGQLTPADKVTAINYIAAYPNDTHDGVSIHNEPRLLQILDLKKTNPDLKVLLSMGGAGEEAGWGEMTGCDSLRAAFAADCKRVVDKYGLDEIDNKILTTIIDKFKGGPVGLTTIATALGEDPGTLEEVYEPYLIKEGFIKRTPRGREVTDLAYSHLHRNRLSETGSLF